MKKPLAVAATALALTAPALGAHAQSSLIPSLVTVDLRNVLNDLAVKLNLDKSNLPITIQLPIQVAANVCGVSINVLSASTGGQANCSATSAPQSLTQAVQLQLAAGGNVGGGPQSTTTAAASAGQSGQPAASTGTTATTSAAPATSQPSAAAASTTGTPK
jgi:hypothetical protein